MRRTSRVTDENRPPLRKQNKGWAISFAADGATVTQSLSNAHSFAARNRDALAARGPGARARPARRRWRPTDPSNHALLRAVLGHGALERVLDFAGVSAAGRLASLNKAWQRGMQEEEAWRCVCAVAGRTYGLYVPATYAPGYQRAFWDLVWPARHKWETGRSAAGSRTGEVGRDFKIRVAARFRPPRDDGEAGSLAPAKAPEFLPLHQRLRLVRSGRIKRADLLVSKEGDLDALMAESALPPGVVDAMAEARRLTREAAAAGRPPQARPRRAWFGEARAAAFARVVDERAVAAEQDASVVHAALAEEGVSSTAAASGRGTAPAGEDGSEADRGSGAAIAVDGQLSGGDGDGEEEEGEGEAGARRRPVRVVGLRDTEAFLYVPGRGLRAFHLSRCLGPEAGQAEVYASVAREPVVAFVNGFNACLLCYGQTGSGKTHTMHGPDSIVERVRAGDDCVAGDDDRGVFLRACEEILAAVDVGDTRDAVAGAGGSATDIDPALRKVGADLVATSATPEAAAKLAAAAAGAAAAGAGEGSDGAHVARAASGCESATLRLQYVQVYNWTLTDLTTGQAIRLRDTGPARGARQFVLEGARASVVRSVADVAAVLAVGERFKRVAETEMNQRSSRAHTVLVATLEQRRGGVAVTSRLHLVDLAGSERVKRSGAQGERMEEAVGINSSLMTLGRCIQALVEDRQHVPYYDALLTRMLKGALGGNSRTTAVIAASPDEADGEETLTSLRFGERCAMVTNTASIGAVSVEDAVREVNAALDTCREALDSQVARGLGHLPVHQRLRERYAALLAKRAELRGEPGAV